MPKKYMTLEEWVGEALTDQDKIDTTTGKVKPCTAIACVLLHPSGAVGKEIHAIPLQSGSTIEPSKIAEKLRKRAEAHSQNMPGMQTFKLQAFYGTREPESELPFRCLEGELMTGDSFTMTESPDSKGIVAQMMRHTEHKDQMLMAVLQGTFGQWASERQKLQSEVNDAYVIVRELMMKDMENRHAFQMQQLAFMRTTDERKSLMSMAPALVNGLTGKDIFPKDTADSAIIDAFARRVTREQLDAMVEMGVIPKELHTPLLSRFAQTLERDRAERAELARAPSAGADEPGRDPEK